MFHIGAQYSVEGFSELGEHVPVAITRKYSDPQSLVELGHVMPAPLEPARKVEIHAYVGTVLDALGVEFGPTHTEIVLTDSGPRVIETHIRVGGDEIWNMVTDATGVDLVEWQLRQTMGEKVLPAIREILAAPDREPRCEAIWFASTPDAGMLVEVVGADRGELPDGTYVHVLGVPGMPLRGLQQSDSRLAWARSRADTAEVALALAQDTVKRLEFVVRVPVTLPDLL